MKTNKTNSSLTKRIFLTLALLSVSLSNAFALNIVVQPDDSDGYSNLNEANGSIHMGAFSRLVIESSLLGNSAGGRFTMSMDDPTPYKNNLLNFTDMTTVYTDGIDTVGLDLAVVKNSNLFVDNDIVIRPGINGHSMVYLMIDSTLKAHSVEVAVVMLEENCYGEFALSARQVELYENSKWVSWGSSTMNSLYLQGGSTVELMMTSATDTISVSDDIIICDADIYFSFNLTNEFIESIIAGDEYFDLVIANTIIGTFTDTFNIYIADTNGYYSWTVTKLSGFDDGSGSNGIGFGPCDGSEIYRLSGFHFSIIPEPSTYAAIFGAIALAFVAYRRRK